VVGVGSAVEYVETEVYLGVGFEYHFFALFLCDYKDKNFIFATKEMSL
jgi:hypothetical protein